MVTLIIKVTNSCNLNCSYCYYLEASRTNRIETMNQKVIEKAIKSRLDFEGKEVRFIWHGGEPLSVGLDFYKKVIQFQEKYKKTNQRIINSLQTNGALLSDEWALFLKETDFKVGVSIDGPEVIHNYNRKLNSGAGSFTEVMKGIETLRKVGLDFGTLTVVTKDSLPYAQEIYRFFVENGINAMDFLPHAELNPRTRAFYMNCVTPLEFYSFLVRVFDLWFEENNPNIHIRTFENILTGLLGGEPTLCKFAGTCSKFLTVQPNGDIYPDDNYTCYDELRFGNLLTTSLDEILMGDRYQTFAQDVMVKKSQCTACKWYSLCNGGCSYRRYMLNHSFYDKEYFCDTWKLLFSYVSKQVEHVRKKNPSFESQ